MLYRTLGRTSLKVSQLGFGAMRLPMTGPGDDMRVDREQAVPMIHRAFEAGVNYIDTAVGYCNQDSQRAVGESLRGWRERIVVSTKNHYFDEDEKTWWKNLEDSLERLQIQAIDVYHHHGVNRDSFFSKVLPRVGQWMRKARDQGLVRHIACSFHDDNSCLRDIVDTGYPEVITLQYNLLDRKLENGIAYAHEKGIGIVVMGPVGGGRLGVDSEVLGKLVSGVRRVPELAMRFVLSNPHVSIALSGMSTMEQVTENTVTAADAQILDQQDLIYIKEHLERLGKMADLYCTGCNYCKPCANQVDIQAVFNLYNMARVYGLWNMARARYADLVKRNQGADLCRECGACEPKCPQRIKIPEQLQEAHEALAGTRLSCKGKG